MSNVCGTGVWSGPLPGDPDNSSVLTATSALGGIDVSWTRAIVNPHAVAHTLVYRGTTAQFSSSVMITAVGGTHYFDKLENQAQYYYYWIQIVSINGTMGEIIGPARAMPRVLIGAVIESLTGQIDKGVLAQSLKADIDKIDILGNDLATEIQNRLAAGELANASIQAAQDDANQAISIIYDEVNQRTTAYDALVQSFNTMAGQVGLHQAAIQDEATLRIAGDASLAQQLSTVQSAYGDDIASVQQTLQTNINTVDGKVTDIGALYTAKVGVNGLVGGFGIYNNGYEVQAGFDVDMFWVGKTSANKRKPFIIVDNQVYIDQAFIRELSADKITTGHLKASIIQSSAIPRYSSGTRIVNSGGSVNYAIHSSYYGTHCNVIVVPRWATSLPSASYTVSLAIQEQNIGGPVEQQKTFTGVFTGGSGVGPSFMHRFTNIETGWYALIISMTLQNATVPIEVDVYVHIGSI